MSSLWTPGGEHSVPRHSPDSSAAAVGSGSPFAEGGVNPFAEGGVNPFAEGGVSPFADEPQRPLTADEEAELAEFMEMQRELAETPAAAIIANHCLGMFQLAALHLQSQQPNLAEARLAIDAFAGVMQGCQGRLGPDESTLIDGLAQIRLAFVQIQQAADA